ncbi:TonB-dependent receptor domain-containing protein [Aggregicoccus sp. 17bor-14]|uniref:TonB-dependent receptor domain-containing protein n=1 Tax=Myxococcaceae TaxID=31 RepID=UPI00351AA6A5
MSPLPPRSTALAAALALALLMLLGAPAARAASSTADEADVAFELGNEAYAKGNFNLALQQYFTSYRLVPNRSVLFNIARCYEALERPTEAYRYYDELSQSPEGLGSGLDDDDVTEVRRSLERLRPKVALVRVDSNPRGADLYVGRLDAAGARGKTPLTLVLPPGVRARLIARKEGFRPAEAFVVPVKGRQLAQALELAPIVGQVELTGSPEGAEVREGGPGGALVGRVPGKFPLSAGRHQLHVSAPGHASASVAVDVPEDGSVQAQVALEEGHEAGPTGRLRVTASREGAHLKVDGKPQGTLPALLTLSEGPHTLEVESNEVRPQQQQVEVVRDQETSVHLALRYTPPPVAAATGRPTPMDALAASTTVLSQEELRAFGYTTLSEALAGVSGFFLTDDRRLTSLGVRGFEAPSDVGSRLLVLWDGHPLNGGWDARAYAGSDLAVDLDEVERLEVVRGPASLLYGSGALLGVVNVVPRDSLGAGQHLEVTGALAALGGVRGHATASLEAQGGPARSLLLSAAVGRSRGAEFTALSEGVTVEGLDEERAASASARARLGSFTLLGQLDARRKDIPTAPRGTLVGAAGTQAQTVRAFAEARWEHRFGERASLSVRGSYDASRVRGHWAYAAGAGRSTDAGATDALGGEARLGLQLGARQQLTLGVQAQGQLRAEGERLAPESDAAPDTVSLPGRTQLGLFVRDEVQLHPRLQLLGGLRVDSVQGVDGLPVSAELALLAHPYAAGLTRLSVGRAFRAPSPRELYAPALAPGAGAVAGSTLGSEYAATLALEHSHDLNDALRLTVGASLTRLSDLVVLAPQDGCVTAACVAFANAEGSARDWSAEAGLHWQPGRLLLVDVSYTWARLEEAPAEVAALGPRHLATARLLLPVADGSVRLATQATYQSARGGGRGSEGGEALLVGLGVSGDYGRLRYFAGVQNLLDAAYALPSLAPSAASAVPQYRRTFTLQLTGSY